MQRFEYVTHDLPIQGKDNSPERWTNFLNQLGSDGWEIVGVAPNVTHGPMGYVETKVVRVLFKRELSAQTQQRVS
jgi:hypothetical protein